MGPPAARDGLTAAWRRVFECVSLLLARQAKVAAKTTGGKTALMGAAAGGNTEVVRALLDAGAKPDVANTLGIADVAELLGSGWRAAAASKDSFRRHGVLGQVDATGVPSPASP